MICEHFKYAESCDGMHKDCWFCAHFDEEYETCDIKEMNVKLQLDKARNHPNQSKLVE